MSSSAADAEAAYANRIAAAHRIEESNMFARLAVAAVRGKTRIAPSAVTDHHHPLLSRCCQRTGQSDIGNCGQRPRRYNPPMLKTLLLGAALMLAAADAPRYSLAERIPGPDGGYDYLSIDSTRQRLYVGR